MRVAAWNIQKGGGDRIEGIARALSEVQADVCVLSEYTNTASTRSIRALEDQGFNYILHTNPQSQWGGVLVASNRAIRLGDIGGCPSPERWLHVVTDDGLELGAAYIPNAERSALEKRKYWEWLLEIGPVFAVRDAAICGDFNTGLPNVDERGSTLKCANQMKAMLESDWTDLWRLSHGQDVEYSWWSNPGNGFRLDHAFGSRTVVSRFHRAEYVLAVGDQCIAHRARRHDGCETRPLSDHSMLVFDIG